MKKCRLLLAAGLLMFLTGCFSQSVEEFYAPPKAPDDYLKLDNEINKVLTQGGEYAAPLSGGLTQKGQLQEAIAFFRVSADERPLKIYIYRQVGENYEVAAVIEGSGNAIDSIYYENLDDSPSKELIVDWETAGQRHSLAAYSIDRYEVLELMRTPASRFMTLTGMDRRKSSCSRWRQGKWARQRALSTARRAAEWRSITSGMVSWSWTPPHHCPTGWRSWSA